MRMLLVGGGKVGSYLAHELEGDGHVVTVIEDHPDRARALAESGSILAFNGDGTDVRLLKAADVDRADWVLAVTGRDEINLVACQLALTLGARRVLARLNDPRNRPTFDALEIPVVAVTDLLAEVISQEVGVADLHRLALVGGGRISVVERTIGDSFPHTPLVDLTLPDPSLIVTVLRDGNVFVPLASTRLRAGDRVVAVTSLENESTLCRVIDALSQGRQP
jgi:trk system potassium uptake protein TrkA